MATVFVGVDVSKGYCDVEVMNEAGSWLAAGGRFDDTRSGHDLLLASLKELRSRGDRPALMIGIESTGGLERNWIKSLRTLEGTVIRRLNPMAVKRFLDQDLHRSVTDRHSARGIARYLAQNRLPRGGSLVGQDEDETAAQVWYRSIQGMIRQVGKLKNQLHSLIQSGIPEVVQYCRSGFPGWVLALLVKYPTAKDLARAKPQALARIPYLTEDRALALVASAKQSVASVSALGMRRAISMTASQILQLQEAIRTEKSALAQEFEQDPGVAILRTIPGIGLWGAVALRVEIGRIERFPSPKALVAYAGLDPRIHQSGDGCVRGGISRRGNRRIRSLIYLLAQVATRENKVMRAFCHRLRSKGKKPKVALIACARKLLHVIYACWVSGKAFDETYEERHAKKDVSPQGPPFLVPIRSLNARATTSPPPCPGRRQKRGRPPHCHKKAGLKAQKKVVERQPPEGRISHVALPSEDTPSSHSKKKEPPKKILDFQRSISVNL